MKNLPFLIKNFLVFPSWDWSLNNDLISVFTFVTSNSFGTIQIIYNYTNAVTSRRPIYTIIIRYKIIVINEFIFSFTSSYTSSQLTISLVVFYHFEIPDCLNSFAYQLFNRCWWLRRSTWTLNRVLRLSLRQLFIKTAIILVCKDDEKRSHREMGCTNNPKW